MRMFFTITLLLFATTAISQSIKLKITPMTPPTGEDVLAFEFSDTIGIGLAAQVKFEFIKIKKTRGTSTNELFRRSITRLPIPEITFEFYNSSNVLYYKMVFKDVTIHHFSYLSPECSGCNELMHQIWFDFDELEVIDVGTGNSYKYNRGGVK